MCHVVVELTEQDSYELKMMKLMIRFWITIGICVLIFATPGT